MGNTCENQNSNCNKGVSQWSGELLKIYTTAHKACVLQPEWVHIYAYTHEISAICLPLLQVFATSVILLHARHVCVGKYREGNSVLFCWGVFFFFFLINFKLHIFHLKTVWHRKSYFCCFWLHSAETFSVILIALQIGAVLSMTSM